MPVTSSRSNDDFITASAFASGELLPISAPVDSDDAVPPQPELLLFSFGGVMNVQLFNLFSLASVLVGMAVLGACSVEAFDLPIPSSSPAIMAAVTLQKLERFFCLDLRNGRKV